MITIAAIRAVADLGGDPVVPKHCREAAVAMILLQGESSFEMMFILRARKEGDPWSGQMALPGGHREPQDLTLAETAARETWEETGLDLAQHGEFLGGLSGVRANPRSGIDLMVVPQVFELQARPSQLAPNYEVQKVLWGDVTDMYSGASSRAILDVYRHYCLSGHHMFSMQKFGFDMAEVTIFMERQ